MAISKRQKIIKQGSTRPKTKQDQTAMMERIIAKLETVKYIYAIRVEGMKNRTMQDLREELKPNNTIFFGRLKLLSLAIKKAIESEKIPKKFEKFEKMLTGPNIGILIGDIDLAGLQAIFQEYSVYNYARVANISSKTVILPKGDLLIGDIPFPPLSLNNLIATGVPAVMKKDKVFLEEDYTICKEGEKLTSNQVNALKLVEIPTIKFSMEIMESDSV